MSDMNRRSALQFEHVDEANVNGKKTFIGKTFAHISGCCWDASNVINKLLQNSGFMDRCYPTEGDDGEFDGGAYFCYPMDNEFSAHSKVNLAKGDTYDKEYGENLAKARCLDKYHKQFNKRMCAFLNDARAMIASVEHYMDKHNIDYSQVESIESMKETKFS